jgi:BlaI family penicillinase repressor
MTKKQLRKLSPANLEIMKIIWRFGEASVNDVFEAINTHRKDKLRRTTIQVQMNRLEEYGWIKHREVGRMHYFRAVRGRQKAERDIINDIKNRVFGGSRMELVKSLLDESELESKEIQELRDLLKKYDKE